MNIRKIILICLISVLMLFPVSASASQEDMAVLEYDGGQKIYVVLPDDYDPDRQYPCVYFMPRDGYSAGEYLDGGTVDRVLELQSGHQIDEMICAFPEYRKGTDIYEQTSGIIEAVEKEYPAVSDAQHRAVLGTGAGGYMAFLLGYSAPDGELLEEPLFFSAVAGHDADFVSEDNPYLQAYGSVYDLLKEAVSTSGADAGRLCSCYTYIDCNLDNVRTLDDGGSADIAYLFRSPGLSGSDSPQAWDYSVFEYAIQDQVQYGLWTDHLAHSLKGFSEAFHKGEDESAESVETETEYTAKETVVSGEERMIDPHIGAFAAIRLGAYFILNFGFASGLKASGWQLLLFGCSFVVSRCLSGLAVSALPLSKETGLPHTFKSSADKKRTAILLRCELLAVSGIMLAAGCILYGVKGIVSAALMLMCAAGMFLYLKKTAGDMFGGLSGDLNGWFLEKAELWMLASLVLTSHINLP